VAAVFAGVFLLLWERYQLAGAVAAWASGEIAYHALVVAAVRREFDGRAELRRTYAAALVAVALCLAGVALMATGDGLRWVLPAGGALGAFVVVAGYSFQEIWSLVLLVLRGRRLVMSPIAE